MCNGQLYQQVTLAHVISVNGYGFSPSGGKLWQTPTVTQINPRSQAAWDSKAKKREATNRYTLPPGTLQEQVMISGEEPCWDWHESPVNERFATPTTMDALPPKSEQALLREMTVARPGRSKPANLRDQVSNMDNWKIFPTPCARDYKDGSFKPETKAKRDEHTRGKPLSEVIGGRLSPDWTESFLMLWPRGWTALEPLTEGAFYSMQPHEEPDGLPRVTAKCDNRAARLKAIGNGQVPLCAATALQLLLGRFDEA